MRISVFILFCLICAGLSFPAFSFVSLVEAIEKGDAEDVAEQLEAGADANAKDQFDRTALHKAAAKGDIKMIEILIANGGNVNAKDAKKETPLHTAAWNGHLEIIKLLIVNKAKADELNHAGQTHKDITALRAQEKTVIPRKGNRENVEKLEAVYDLQTRKAKNEKKIVPGKGFNLTLDEYVNKAWQKTLKFDKNMNVVFHDGAKNETLKGTYEISCRKIHITFRGRNGMLLRIAKKDADKLVDLRKDMTYTLKEGIPVE